MAINIPLTGDTLTMIQTEIAKIELPQGWVPLDLPTDEKPTGTGEIGIIYVQPNGTMWAWSDTKNDYIQLNGLTDLSNYPTKVDMNTADGNTFNLAKQYTDNSITKVSGTITYLTSTVTDLESKVDEIDLSDYATKEELSTTAVIPLSDHKDTDRFRWQDAYDGERDSIIRDAANNGLMANQSAIVSLEQADGSLPITDMYGGVFGVTMKNTDTTFSTITVNETLLYSSDGLTAGIPITKYFWLKPNDTVTWSNAQSILYIPFVQDNNSQLVILTKQLEQTQLELADLKASVEGKSLDTTSIVDIESLQPYTVSNALGGRIHYTGLNVLITTWALYVNDTAVRNGSLLGLGTTQGDYDVKSGDVVDSIGMTGLTFTPYKAGV